MAQHRRIDVQFSEDMATVTLHLSGRSQPIVVGCLGVDRDVSGSITRIYLNAQLHRVLQAGSYSGWEPSGAITTILERVA